MQLRALASARQLVPLRKRVLDACRARRDGGRLDTGVRWFIKYCIFARGESPVSKLHAGSALGDKIEREQLLMDFCLWLAVSKPSGRQISVKTIRGYLSSVRAWHLREFRTHICGDLDYKQLSDFLKGITRVVQQPARRRRFGVRTQDLAKALEKCLAANTAANANWRAALVTAFCGLMRGAEIALQGDESFNTLYHLTRADVSFEVGEDGVEYVVLMMRTAKKGPEEGKTTPLILGGGGKFFDPVRELRRLFTDDPVPREQWASTPLFRVGLAPMRVAWVRDVVKALMGAVGCEPARFGAHSLRIGGATAAYAAGVPPATIRLMGRWSSEIYMIYTRMSKEVAVGLAAAVGSTPFEDLEREFDGELGVKLSELPSYLVAEDDMIADAIDD